MTGRFFNYLIEIPAVWMILWLGLAGLTGALLVLMVSRWGQSRPLRKCAVLSLVAHVLLACLATTVQIVTGVTGSGTPLAMQVAVVDAGDPAGTLSTQDNDAAPWHVPPDQPPLTPDLPRGTPPAEVDLEARPVEPSALADLAPKHAARGPSGTASPPHDAAPEAVDRPQVAMTKTTPPPLAPIATRPTKRYPAEDPLVPLPQKLDSPAPPVDPIAERAVTPRAPLAPGQPPAQPVAPTLTASDATPASVRGQTVARTANTLPPTPAVAATEKLHGSGPPPAANQALTATGLNSHSTVTVDPMQIVNRAPVIYRNRFAPDRCRVARAHGGSAATEASVEAALRWLATNQNADGRWDADRYAAGQERAVLGRNRYNAGLRADTGMTGLALLAFLGAGQTHVTGKHQATVGRGLDFLISVQANDGSLAGNANLYAHMYCHAMATFAVSEAFAMTGDTRLEPVVRRAVQFSLKAQNPLTGGWRYLPGDPGDTSQLGWQAMALKSAQLAGVAVPQQTWLAIERFLDSVAAGPRRGLASYRPRSAPSRTMTAEALACRRLLTSRASTLSEREAIAYLLDEPPGTGRPNFYYWYYATLAMFQIQGQPWQRWNQALKTTLVASQRTGGADAGSWDTNTVWGGYGGRVYCTAMATLSLEVYYRYLPVYAEAARLNRHLR